MAQEITKEDWQKVIQIHEANIINNLISLELFRANIEYAKKKLAEFKEDEDKMPEGIKEIVESQK